MTQPHRRILAGLLLAVLCLLPAAGLLAQQPVLLAGNDQGSFLVVPEGADQFTLLARPADQDWRKVAAGVTGTPVLAQAAGANCYVAFRRGDFGAYDGAGNSVPIVAPSSSDWPRNSRLLAMTAFRPSDSKQPPVILVLAGIAPGAATRPAGEPAAATSHPTTTRSATADQLDLQIFQYSGGQWSRWGSLGPCPWRADTKAFMASHNGKVWLLISGGGRPNRLFSTDGKTSQPLAVEGHLADSEAIGLVVADNALVAVLSRPAPQGRRTLELAVLEDGAKPSYEAVKTDGRPHEWSASSLPVAAAMRDQVGFAWRQDSKLMWSPCRLDGKMAPPRELQEVLQATPGRGEIYYNYYMMGVFVAIMAFAFVLRPRGSDVPFALPPEMAPGKLFKRLVAAAIDFFPFLVVSMLVFQVPQVNSDEAMAIVQGKAAMPESLWYASMAATAGFAIYGMIMEGVLGATLGKLAMGLRVCGNGGGPPDWRAVILRNLMKIMELSWRYVWPLILLFPILSRNRQRLGDLMARTAVVDKRLREVPAPPPAEQQTTSVTRDQDDRDETP